MESMPVLLLDPREDTRLNACFLLQLAGYRVTTIDAVDEAFNWIVNRRDSADRFRLLLINRYVPEMGIAEATRELDRLGAPVPILVIDRENSMTRLRSLIERCTTPQLIQLSKPEQMIEYVRRLTDRAVSPASPDAPQTACESVDIPNPIKDEI